MKKYIILICSAVIFLASCSSSKNYLERSDADKALVDAANKLSKSPDDERALEALPILYKAQKDVHLAKIASMRTSNDLSKWDKIIGEYKDLQSAYDAIINSTAAFRLITPQNFSTDLLDAREQAASDYYDLATSFEKQGGRENAKSAYTYFTKAERYVPGFKDSRNKKAEAFNKAIVNVVINPVEDQSFFFNSGWGNAGYNYSNEYFQQKLLRDLQNRTNTSNYAARFYTDWEARRNEIQPDWVVDLRLRNLDIPQPYTRNYSRQVSNRIQTGTDTSGRATYQTVYATMTVYQQSFNARGTMDVIVRDVKSNMTISNRSYSDTYNWQQESGTYSGDRRALSSNDWAIINNRNYNNQPRKEDVLNELYRDIYPQVRSSIERSVDW